MRNIKARFDRFNKEPLSSYLAFARAVQGQKFTRASIVKNFSEMVVEQDYDKSEKKALISNLFKLSEGAVEHEKQPKNQF